MPIGILWLLRLFIVSIARHNFTLLVALTTSRRLAFDKTITDHDHTAPALLHFLAQQSCRIRELGEELPALIYPDRKTNECALRVGFRAELVVPVTDWVRPAQLDWIGAERFFLTRLEQIDAEILLYSRLLGSAFNPKRSRVKKMTHLRSRLVSSLKVLFSTEPQQGMAFWEREA